MTRIEKENKNQNDEPLEKKTLEDSRQAAKKHGRSGIQAYCIGLDLPEIHF